MSADLRYNKSSCLTDKRKTPFSSEKFTSPFFSSKEESADSASTSFSSFSFSFKEKYNQETQIQRASVLQKKYELIQEDDLAIIDYENMFQTQKDISQQAKQSLRYKVKSKPKK